MKRLFFLLLTLLLVCCHCFACTAQEPEITIGDSKGYEPWYLSVSHLRAVALPEVPEELQDLRIQLPTEYNLLMNGIELELDFFQEYYSPGELIQLRITMTNHRESDLRFCQENSGGYSPTGKHPGMCERSDGECLGINEACSAVALNGDGWAADSVKDFSLAPGGTAVYECAFTADPAFFVPDDEFTYSYVCLIQSEGNDADAALTVPVTVTHLPAR